MTEAEFEDWYESQGTQELVKMLQAQVEHDISLLTADGNLTLNDIPFLNRARGELRVKRLITNKEILRYALTGDLVEEIIIND